MYSAEPFTATTPSETLGVETGAGNVSDGSTLWAMEAGEEHASETSPGFQSLPLPSCPIPPAGENMALIPGVQYTTVVSEDGNYFEGASFAPSLLSPNYQLDFRASPMDWLDFHVPGLPIPNSNLLASNAIPPVSGALPPIETRQAVQSWPFDQTQDLVPHQFKLPPLRLVLQGALDSHNQGREDIPKDLLQLLSEPWLPPLDSLDHYNLLSAYNLLKRLVDVYFTRFHPIQPVTHIPSWNLMSCPTVLLAAMACIGAMLSDDPGASHLSESLSKLCIPMMTWLVSFVSVVHANHVGCV
jgi:hypothetical protein